MIRGSFRAAALKPAALILLTLLALGTGAWAQVPVSVLQTNIHRDIGGSDSNTGSQNALAQQVNYLNPDIWTINELGGNDVSFNLTTATNDLKTFIQTNLTIFGTNPVAGQNYFLYVGTFTDGYITQAIVSRYAIISAQTFSDAGSGNSALRGLTEATISVPGAGLLSVFTAHLKALSDDGAAQKRMAEATADRATIANWIVTHPANGVIVTGDFNETVETTTSDNWGSGNLGDAITFTNGSTATYNPVAALKSAGLLDPRPTSSNGSLNTISATNPTSRFDYILYAPQKLSYVSGQVFNTAFGTTSLATSTSRNASDHLAVFERFLLAPEPSSLVFTLVILGGAIYFPRHRGKAGLTLLG